MLTSVKLTLASLCGGERPEQLLNSLENPGLNHTEEMSRTPVKTPVKTPKSPKPELTRQGSVPKFSSSKYYFDIDVLKCPLCSRVFSSPRVLPCGHSACMGCLSNLILYTDSSKSRDYFLCPVCQKMTRSGNNVLKQKWAAQYPVNATLERVLKNTSTGSIAEKTSRRAFCQICLKNNRTKTTHAYCNNCLEYQCEICASHHEVTEETKDHEMIWYIPKKEKKPEPAEIADAIKVQIVKPSKPGKPEKEEIVPEEQQQSSDPNGRAPDDKKVKIDLTVRERKFAPVVPIPPVVVAHTITASTAAVGKTVIRLGYFNGKASGDGAISDFHGIAFLTDGKVAMTDFNNKKIKIFDITHKTRVELISDIILRASPKAICRVDQSTFAVVTERTGLYHIRLFTLRDKIQYFVQKIVEGSAIGIAYISKTIVCTFKQDNQVHKYKLSRSQQLKTGTIKHDPYRNNLFKSPGVVTSGFINGCPVMYVADENELGVTVMAVDIMGRRKMSVFFECDEARPKKKVRTADVAVTKSGRLRSRKSTLKQDEASESTTESEADKNSKSTKKSRQSSGSTDTASAKKDGRNPTIDESMVENLDLNLNQTFPKIIDKRRIVPSPKGRQTERLRQTNGLIEELNPDLNASIDGHVEVKESVSPKPSSRRILVRNRSGIRESAKVDDTYDRPKTVPQRRKTDARLLEPDDAKKVPVETDDVFERPKTVPQIHQKVYRADGLAVDIDGNIYVCMCSTNKVLQTTPDGRVKQDLLTERDGILAPKAISFSPSNDVFLVTCANSNKVAMFRIK